MTFLVSGGGTVELRSEDIVSLKANAVGCDAELRDGRVVHLAVSAVDVQRLLAGNPHGVPGLVERG